MNYVAHLSDVQHSGARQPFWQPAATPGDRIERIPVRGVRKATAKAMVLRRLAPRTCRFSWTLMLPAPWSS